MAARTMLRGRTAQRVTIGLLVLALLLAIAWLVARTAATRGEDSTEAAGTPQPTTPATRPPQPDTDTPGRGDGEAERGDAPEPDHESAHSGLPPRSSDPLEFAAVAAAALWSYDTRTTSHRDRTDQLKQWMTPETDYQDWESIASQVPAPELWERLADNQQHATADILDAWHPASFEQALRDDPEAITYAYLYAVTVHGRQDITWSDGGRGAETRMATLVVQCRPGQDCALAARLPGVAH
jgi:hypothetical protein